MVMPVDVLIIGAGARPQDHAERINRVAQNAAVARGAQLRVAPTEQEAVAWLLS
jgi:hypothetical protein